MHVNHASHALFKIQSGVLKKCIHSLWTWYERRISKVQRWQIIGMRSTRISFKASGRQMGYHYTIVNWIVRNHTHINTIKDLPRSGRPHVTSQNEDRALDRLVSHSQPALFWKTNGYQIVRNCLTSAGLKSRRLIKRPMLSGRHQPLRLAWWLARRCLNLKDLVKDPLVGQEQFLLHKTDGQMRFWR